MSIGTVFLILALLSLSGLGIFHKVADFYRCRPSAVAVMLFFWAAAVLWGYTLFYKSMGQQVSLFPPFTSSAVGVAAVCGAFAGVAILAFQVGVRYGRISTSWLVINLSTIVPALLSLAIYREWQGGVRWQQLAGLTLVAVSVFLLWKDKAVEIARGEQPIPQRPLGSAEAPVAGSRRQVSVAAGPAVEQEA